MAYNKNNSENIQFGNILVCADYRMPNSGNFVASLLDLGKTMKDRGSQAMFYFQIMELRGGRTGF